MNKLSLVSLVVSLSAFGLFAVKGFAQEETRDPHIWSDPETHCQYLVTPEGGISRRMVDNGVIYIHMGCKPLVDIKQPPPGKK